MAQKCVHKGCGKTFSDPEEPCIYHPGPPEFHEGQKGNPMTGFPTYLLQLLTHSARLEMLQASRLDIR